MKLNLKSYIKNNRDVLKSKNAKIGGYSLLMAVIVFAILVAVNVLVTALPSKWTQFDISEARLYSLTTDSKEVVTNLDQDVTIYWICQKGQEDTVIQKLLNVYDGLSDHLTVEEKDPDQYPDFASQYTSGDVTNNDLVVVCGDRNRYISYSSIYEQDSSNYYTTGSVSTSFDGESQITTAIDYVISEDLSKIYVLTGHGDGELSDTMTSALEKENLETEEFSLLNEDEIPEDADGILIYAPTSDLSEEEVSILQDYLDNGGHLMVFSGPQEDGNLTNLDQLLTNCGVSVADGVVLDTDREHYAFNYPYILMPEIESSDITDPLTEDGDNVIIPVSGGMTVGEDQSDYTVTQLLTTSEESYAKADGYSMTTYDKEDQDTDGPFALAVSVESSNGGKMVWVASDNMMTDEADSYSSGANTDFTMNSISWMIGESDTHSLSIRSKSLDYNYLTISASAATLIKFWLILVIPAFYLILGIGEVVFRRKRR